MIQFHTKTSLYRCMESIRSEFGLPFGAPIHQLYAHLNNLQNLKIASVPFETTALHGMCSFGEVGQADVILLNSHRQPIDQNFDLAHEFIHIHEHRDGKKPVICCYDRVTDKQDPFIEWQANEGAAQLLVPYQDFIPRFVQLISEDAFLSSYDPRRILADYYSVSTQVINLRIDNLSYEIDQYRAGVPIDRIQLLSRAQQKRKGIRPTSYQAMIDFAPVGRALDWDSVIG